MLQASVCWDAIECSIVEGECPFIGGQSKALYIYIDALLDHATYQSGVFYGSKKGLSGELSDQAEFLNYFANEAFQDNANEAIHKFINK
mmetsp:Transcript_10530/g.31033  ORF Transcript_10530/g.31033 Transcript_10530/m.31033 type:complete len:89 (-) Transcript_10530:46-312(-)